MNVAVLLSRTALVNESLSLSNSRVEACARAFLSSIELSMQMANSEVSLHLLKCIQSQRLISFPIGRACITQVTNNTGFGLPSLDERTSVRTLC